MTFYENYMALSPRKWHYLIINKDMANECMELGRKTLHAEAQQKLLDIIIYKDLNFKSHTQPITETANQKLWALVRVAPFITDFNKKITFNSFIRDQFKYCPFFWMFSTRAVNIKLNRLYEKGVRASSNDKIPTFNDMYQKVTILLFM